jgi:hypothetical protein
MAGAEKMNMPNRNATEGTFTAKVAVEGENHPFDAQTVSIRGPGSEWLVSAEYRTGDLLLSLDLVINKAELPSDGTLTTFELNPANSRKAYGRCGYFKDEGNSYDMLSTSGLLEISFNKLTDKMTGDFNFDAAGGDQVSSITDARFSLSGLAQSIQA